MPFLPSQTSITINQASRTASTVKAVAVLSAIGYCLNFSRFADTKTNPIGFGLMFTGFIVEIATSTLTLFVCPTWGEEVDTFQQELEAQNQMPWKEYLRHVGCGLVNPCSSLRRFFAGGNFLSDILMIPAEIMLMSNYSTLIGVLMPPYALAKVASLALPVRDDVAFISFGFLKTAFASVALVLASMEKENQAVIIAAEVLLLASGLLSIASGVKTFTEVRANDGFSRV